MALRIIAYAVALGALPAFDVKQCETIYYIIVLFIQYSGLKRQWQPSNSQTAYHGCDASTRTS